MNEASNDDRTMKREDGNNGDDKDDDYNDGYDEYNSNGDREGGETTTVELTSRRTMRKDFPIMVELIEQHKKNAVSVGYLCNISDEIIRTR